MWKKMKPSSRPISGQTVTASKRTKQGRYSGKDDAPCATHARCKRRQLTEIAQAEDVRARAAALTEQVASSTSAAAEAATAAVDTSTNGNLQYTTALPGTVANAMCVTTPPDQLILLLFCPERSFEGER
jgi:hypothetical protein